MRLLLFLTLCTGCAHRVAKKELCRDHNIERACIDQARSSYILGCKEAGRHFNECVAKAKLHAKELKQILCK